MLDLLVFYTLAEIVTLWSASQSASPVRPHFDQHGKQSTAIVTHTGYFKIVISLLIDAHRRGLMLQQTK